MRIDAIIVRDHRETYVATIDDEIVKGKEEKKGKNYVTLQGLPSRRLGISRETIPLFVLLMSLYAILSAQLLVDHKGKSNYHDRKIEIYTRRERFRGL